MDTKETELYLDFLSYAFNGGPGHGAEVTCELDYTKGTVYECVINSPGLGYELYDTFTIDNDDENAPLCTGVITEVYDIDGSVLSFMLYNDDGYDIFGLGYLPGINKSTSTDGDGEGLTIDIVSVRYPIKNLNIIEPGEGYYGDGYCPFPPFGTPRLIFSDTGGEFIEPIITCETSEGGLDYINIDFTGAFPSTPTVTVEPWIVKSTNELTTALNIFDNTRVHDRMHDVLTDYVQCNVTQEEDNLIINDMISYVSNRFNIPWDDDDFLDWTGTPIEDIK